MLGLRVKPGWLTGVMANELRGAAARAHRRRILIEEARRAIRDSRPEVVVALLERAAR